MGAFYIHDGQRLISIGSCPDGQEHLQPRNKGERMVIGPPPCDLSQLGPDDEWSIKLRKIVPRYIPEEELWARVRYQRDQLLAATDWRVTVAQESGTPMAPEWVLYRQQLRDVTEQPDPAHIVWPTPPA